MQGKPIITIDKFSGSGAGGIWYNNGLVAHKENGQSMLMEDFKQVKIVDDTDTNNTGLGTVRAISYLGTLASNDLYSLILDNTGQVFARRYIATSILSSYAIGASAGASEYPDITQLPSGNLIYSRADYLGLLVRGKVKTGSSTTKIIDSAGRNFETLGLTTGGSELTSYVTNLKTGKKYLITSITDGDATKDALNFDAIGASANTANDEFIAIVATKFDLDAGLTLPTFKGQELTQANWARQIRQFDDYWFITNGNFLAILDSDEATFDNNYKQLPYGHQAMAIETNGVKIMVASQTADGAGYLLLWDGYSDGWLAIRKVGGVPKAIINYENGFVYMVDGRLFYTDGYNDTLLGKYNDTNEVGSALANINPVFFNSLCQTNGMIFCASTTIDYNRVHNGIYYWSSDFGWGYMPILYGTQTYYDGTANGRASAVFKREGSVNRVEIGHSDGLNYLATRGSTTATNQSKSFIYAVSLPQNQQVKEIGLNIGVNPEYYSLTSDDVQCKISVNVGDGRSGITKYYPTVNVTATTTVANTNGSAYRGFVGKEVLFTSGAMAGERTYITSIADAGTVNEVWTVSPALSTTGNTVNCLQYMVDQTETRTISINDINKEQRFSLKKECLGNKLIIEVVIHGVATSFPVAIQGVNIYG